MGMKKLALLSSLLVLCLFQLSAQSDKDFYAVEKIQNIEIKFEQDNWKYILDSLRVNGNGMLLADVTINGEKYPDSGVRYRGTTSFAIGSARNPLHIKLNYINKKRKHQGISTIKLSNAIRDPSMIREVLGYEIARTYMAAPRANYARTYVNNQYYGLYINVEAIGDDFLERQFNNATGSFFKCNPEQSYDNTRCNSDAVAALAYAESTRCYLHNFEIESEDGWDDLIALTEVLKNQPQNIEQVLDVDRTLWMLAFNNTVVNLSSYSGQNSQNYYLYQDTMSKQFVPIIWDLNLAFGSFKNTGSGSDLQLRELMNMNPLLHQDNPSKPLLNVLLKNAAYRNIYLNHIRTIVKEWFLNEKYALRARELQQMIRKPLTDDQNWPYNINEFNRSLNSTVGKKSRIPGIIELMEKRGKFLYAHKALSVLPPKVITIEAVERKKLSSRKIQAFNLQAKIERRPKSVKVFYRFDATKDYQMTMMYDDGKHGDNAASDEIFGTKITPPTGKTTMEYYLLMENPKAASFSPTHYMFERHTASLEELNK